MSLKRLVSPVLTDTAQPGREQQCPGNLRLYAHATALGIAASIENRYTVRGRKCELRLGSRQVRTQIRTAHIRHSQNLIDYNTYILPCEPTAPS